VDFWRLPFSRKDIPPRPNLFLVFPFFSESYTLFSLLFTPTCSLAGDQLLSAALSSSINERLCLLGIVRKRASGVIRVLVLMTLGLEQWS
jgi:hypothetical protein